MEGRYIQKEVVGEKGEEEKGDIISDRMMSRTTCKTLVPLNRGIAYNVE